MTKKKEDHEVIKDIFEKVDPMETAIMILGGTAAANGITPPVTRLLQALTGMSKSGTSGTQAEISKDLVLAWSLTAGSFLYPAATLGQTFGTWIGNLFRHQQTGGTTKPITDEQKKEIDQFKATIALFASGAIEAMIMYKLVSNPETFNALIKLPGQTLTAVSGLGGLPKV